MPPRIRTRLAHLGPALLPPLVAGLTLLCLFFGYEPIGADPDGLYRPIKSELARSLEQGTLPFWSDRLGVGVPLVAESHAAAFYPPNWPLYRFLPVAWAYRLGMWLPMVATAIATFLYARCLGLEGWGAALASVAFSLCGYQASHSGHEPLYGAMPYLPLCLLAADRLAATGRAAWMAALALAWGVQITVGHFQIQFWTGTLALILGGWRALDSAAPRRRIALLLAALLGGLAVAAAQIVPTRELMRVSGFTRSYKQLSIYSFPPSHLIQPAFPWLFARQDGPDVIAYWGPLETTADEAFFYIGTVPLILAFVGFAAERQDRGLALWRWIVPATLMLATMPYWFEWGYWFLTLLPGLGWFRSPGRYTLLTSLGLALLAGRGLDATVSARRFRIGVTAAILFGLASLAWGFLLANQPRFLLSVRESSLPLRFGAMIGSWLIGLAVVIAHRRGWDRGWVPVVAASLELAALYHLGPVRWGRSVPSPQEGPILRQMARIEGAGLVASPFEDLPVRAGITAAYPYLGIAPPPPNYLLETARNPFSSAERGSAQWLRHFGVTHGIWREGDSVRDCDVLFVSEDATLDWLTLGLDANATPTRWKIVRYRSTWPAAWTSRAVRIVPDWITMYRGFPRSKTTDLIWYIAEDAPPDSPFPRAKEARVRSWDGRTAIVDHDGTCDLVVRRTFYPGWTARVEGVGPVPIVKADAGLQSVRLEGRGPSRVTFAYRPTGIVPAAVLSIGSASAFALMLAASLLGGSGKKVYPEVGSVHSEG